MRKRSPVSGRFPGGGNKKSRGGKLQYGIRFAFVAMVVLFFVNTMILTWHMDKNDFYSSIKGRLEGLKKQIPWAKSVRETVTHKPNSLRNGAAHGKGNENQFLKFFDKNGNNNNNNKNLRRDSIANGNAKYKNSWSELTGSSVFVELEEGRWAELHDDKAKFHFTVIEANLKDGNDRSVTLYDASRSITIMLLERQSLLKMGHSEEFTPLYAGYWATFNGKVETNEFGNYDEHLPPEPYLEGELKDQTIVVMLAAYRDPMCGNTLFELFEYAKYPERISAVVVEQNGPNDIGCLQDYCEIAAMREKECFKDRVKVETVPLDHARGVMPGRYRQNLLLDDQEFCLQVDSHSAFENDWEMIALEDWMLTKNEMAVITGYPNMVRDKHDQRHAPARCSTKFSNDKEVVHGGNAALNVAPSDSPYLIPFFGAGTSFSKCHANYNVPYDPYMSHLFGGEEFNRAVRLYTSGYDLYAPRRNFVYHYYDADKKPPRGDKPRNREFFNVNGKKRVMSTQTTARWRTILGLKLTNINPVVSVEGMRDYEYFGLGTRRKMEQYAAFSQVNLKKGTSQNMCDFLGRMKWQPYHFTQPFYPSGDKCPYRTMKDITKYCCTTLDKVKESTIEFLNKDNDKISDELISSPEFVQELDPKPILSPLNNNAVLKPCPEQIDFNNNDDNQSSQQQQQQQEEEDIN